MKRLLPPPVRTLALALLVVVPPAQPPAAGQASLEYEVKAAYVLNFLSYTEWPAAAPTGASEAVKLCITDRDPFGGTIDRVVQGQRIAGRPVSVERLTAAGPAAHCDLLFVPASVEPGLWIKRAGPHTLTVGESSDFLDHGGMIELVVDAGRVRFDVNLGAVAARNIRLSSRLLRLARSTVRGPA